MLFEVEGNYARAYFGSNRPLIRASLNALEAKLDPALFFRASRQHIVNLRFIESVETAPDDTYIIHLKNRREAAGVATPVATAAREPGLVISVITFLPQRPT